MQDILEYFWNRHEASNREWLWDDCLKATSYEEKNSAIALEEYARTSTKRKIFVLLCTLVNWYNVLLRLQKALTYLISICYIFRPAL